MGTLTSIAAVALDGVRWVLLALATGLTHLADAAKKGAKRLRR